ncbi:MAG: Ig-like domain-containing protein [Cyclobacteriaceae bacterium]|nr:Ig-like domain-containing protein [Cyclobacteriaceae bacterium]MCH8516955.1 Ig-like domain-containing protein [Cyclobacteriaceae bacterium]
MRQLHLIKTLILLVVAGMLFTACGDDEDSQPEEFGLQSLTATGDIDLNAAQSPTNVGIETTITAVFNRDIDAATVSEESVILNRDYDGEQIPLEITVDGNTITITPDPLGEGTQYLLELSAEVFSVEGEAITSISRGFTTSGSFVPSNQIAYFPFDGDAIDAVGEFNPASSDVVDIIWGEDRLGNSGSAATFDGNRSIIEIPNGPDLLNDNWTVAYWMYLDTEDHLDANGNPAGHFIMGLGNFRGFQFETNGTADFIIHAAQYELSDSFEGETAGNNMFFNGDGEDRDAGGFYATTFRRDLGSDGVPGEIRNRWAHIVFTYDGSNNVRKLYMNGRLMQTDDLASLVETVEDGEDVPDISTARSLTFLPGDAWGSKLALGFVHDRTSTEWANEPWGSYELETSNHFKGKLDDLRIFHQAISEREVELLHNSEAP